MSETPFQEQLVDYIEDAHAMEQHVKVALAAFISSAPDVPELQEPLNHHKEETEHLEIASYELLERMAKRAGDEETAEVARLNRADEVAMAKKLEASWDLALDVSLAEEGISGAPPMGDPGSMAGTKPPDPGTAR